MLSSTLPGRALPRARQRDSSWVSERAGGREGRREGRRART